MGNRVSKENDQEKIGYRFWWQVDEEKKLGRKVVQKEAQNFAEKGRFAKEEGNGEEKGRHQEEKIAEKENSFQEDHEAKTPFVSMLPICFLTPRRFWHENSPNLLRVVKLRTSGR